MCFIGVSCKHFFSGHLSFLTFRSASYIKINLLELRFVLKSMIYIFASIA